MIKFTKCADAFLQDDTCNLACTELAVYPSNIRAGPEHLLQNQTTDETCKHEQTVTDKQQILQPRSLLC